ERLLARVEAHLGQEGRRRGPVRSCRPHERGVDVRTAAPRHPTSQHGGGAHRTLRLVAGAGPRPAVSLAPWPPSAAPPGSPASTGPPAPARPGAPGGPRATW